MMLLASFYMDSIYVFIYDIFLLVIINKQGGDLFAKQIKFSYII
jgi:hypothetical protein